MDDLERLFAAYREALPDPEPSAGFTPGVWQRIEARRSPVVMLRRLTEALVTVSALVAVLVGLFLIPRMQSSPVYSATYVDVLANEAAPDTLAYADVIQPDPAADPSSR
jgi:hypothetical protein